MTRGKGDCYNLPLNTTEEEEEGGTVGLAAGNKTGMDAGVDQE